MSRIHKTHRPSSRAPWIYFCSLLGLALLSSLVPQGGQATNRLPRTINSTTAIPSLAGSWSGTWTDTMFSVGGSLTFDIVQTGANFTGTGTIDLSTFGLGSQQGTASGTLANDTLSFTFDAAGMGTGTGSVNGTAGSGSGTVIGSLDFGDFTFIGTVDGITLNGSFDFTSASGGAGIASLSKTTSVKATQWGTVKQQYAPR